MGRKVESRTGEFRPDLQINELAARQRGRVAWWQLQPLGIPRHIVDTRIAQGLLIPEHQGVYRLGGQQPTWKGEVHAALLASGPGSAVSHRAAGVLWGFIDGESAIEVSAPRSRAKLVGVIVHRPRSLEEDVVQRDGLRVTTPARTLVDLCASLSASHVARLYNEAQIQRVVTCAELAEVLDRSYGRRGISKLRRMVRDETPPTRSQLEKRFVRLVADAGLPAPRMNVSLRIDGRVRELDAHWPDLKLAVELDSWKIHGVPGHFESDRERDVDFVVDGWRVVRFTWARLRDDRGGVIRDMRRLIEGVG